MGMVSGRVGSAAWSWAAVALGPPLSGERMGRKALRFASSLNVLVWYLGVRPRAHGKAQICRKWTSFFDSFSSECAIPRPPVVNCTSPRFIR